MTRPFRFGVQLRAAHSSWEWAENARRAEAAGFSSLLVPDHLNEQLSPMPALVAAASATSTLRVGTLVMANDLRHPVMLAKEAATVDLLADGRLELGIGAGWRSEDNDALGIPFDPPGVRVERFEESVGLLRRLLDGEAVTHAGPHYELASYALTPVPAGKVPLMIGGGGRRVLGIAGRHADIVGITFDMRAGPAGAMHTATAECTIEKVAWLAEASGTRFDEIELQLLIPITRIGASSAVVDGVAEATGLTAEEVAAMPPVLAVDSVTAAVDALLERRDRYGFSYIVFAGDVIDDVAPVVAELAGR